MNPHNNNECNLPTSPVYDDDWATAPNNDDFSTDNQHYPSKCATDHDNHHNKQQQQERFPDEFYPNPPPPTYDEAFFSPAYESQVYLTQQHISAYCDELQRNAPGDDGHDGGDQQQQQPSAPTQLDVQSQSQQPLLPLSLLNKQLTTKQTEQHGNVSAPHLSNLPYHQLIQMRNSTVYYMAMKKYFYNQSAIISHMSRVELWTKECHLMRKRNQSWGVFLKRKEHKPLPPYPQAEPNVDYNKAEFALLRATLITAPKTRSVGHFSHLELIDDQLFGHKRLITPNFPDETTTAALPRPAFLYPNKIQIQQHEHMKTQQHMAAQRLPEFLGALAVVMAVVLLFVLSWSQLFVLVPITTLLIGALDKDAKRPPNKPLTITTTAHPLASYECYTNPDINPKIKIR